MGFIRASSWIWVEVHWWMDERTYVQWWWSYPKLEYMRRYSTVLETSRMGNEAINVTFSICERTPPACPPPQSRTLASARTRSKRSTRNHINTNQESPLSLLLWLWSGLHSREVVFGQSVHTVLLRTRIPMNLRLHTRNTDHKTKGCSYLKVNAGNDDPRIKHPLYCCQSHRWFNWVQVQKHFRRQHEAFQALTCVTKWYRKVGKDFPQQTKQYPWPSTNPLQMRTFQGVSYSL